jgi:capsule biosynthesis phosphatase
MKEDKRIVMDIDGVLAKKDSERDYNEKEVDKDILSRLEEYSENGFYIILYTARNMRTHEGRIGKINADTAPTLLEWLDEKGIPYDEIHYGKPWCGHDGFYVDDKAIRPSEFENLNHEEIRELVEDEER